MGSEVGHGTAFRTCGDAPPGCDVVARRDAMTEPSDCSSVVDDGCRPRRHPMLLDAARDQAADDVALQRAGTAPSAAPRGRHPPRRRPSSATGSPRRTGTGRLRRVCVFGSIRMTPAITNSPMVPMNVSSPTTTRIGMHQAQHDREEDACVAGAVDLRRLVDRRRHGVEEAVHEERVHAERAAEVDHDQPACVFSPIAGKTSLIWT